QDRSGQRSQVRRGDRTKDRRELGEVDRLGLEVRFEALDTALAAAARLLEAANRHFDVDVHAVDGHAARSYTPCDVVATLRILRARGPVQPVDRAVRLGDGIFDPVITDERDNGTKDLFLCNGHPALHIREDGRLYEVSALELWVASAARHELRPFLLAFRDVPL